MSEETAANDRALLNRSAEIPSPTSAVPVGRFIPEPEEKTLQYVRSSQSRVRIKTGKVIHSESVLHCVVHYHMSICIS